MNGAGLMTRHQCPPAIHGPARTGGRVFPLLKSLRNGGLAHKLNVTIPGPGVD